MESQKHLFSLNPNQYYLNCAYKSPLLKSAEAAAIEILKRNRNPADLTINDFFDDTEIVKSLFSNLVNASSENIAIIPSVSYGFSSVLNNLEGKKSGFAITVEDFFPSGYFSLQTWCKQNVNDLMVVPQNLKDDNQSWNERIISSINTSTSLVAMPHVHWANGYLFDLEQIGRKCKDVGAKLIIDGTQSVGALPIDVRKYNIDALICASYKWLFGAYSLGLAYMSDDFINGTPLEESWMNRTNAKDFSSLTSYEQTYKPGVARYNVGETSNMILMPILKAGLNQITSWKPEAIQEYASTLRQPLNLFLEENDILVNTDSSAHLFALNIPKIKDQNHLISALKENQVIVSVRGSSIRVSVNVFNDSRDIEKLIEVIDFVLKKNLVLN